MHLKNHRNQAKNGSLCQLVCSVKVVMLQRILEIDDCCRKIDQIRHKLIVYQLPKVLVPEFVEDLLNELSHEDRVILSRAEDLCHAQELHLIS